MKHDHHELFDTPELIAAFDIIKARCRQDGIRLALIHPTINLSPEIAFPTELNQRPQRHDPAPTIPHDALADREAKAIARAVNLIRRWANETGFTPPIRDNPDWQIVHNDKCASRTAGGPLCDCRYLTLLRFANQTFAVEDLRSLEPFTSPPPTLADLSCNDMPLLFLLDEGKNIMRSIKMDFRLPTSFVVGEGSTARTVGKPNTGRLEGSSTQNPT
jgi:hypothetical protein